MTWSGEVSTESGRLGPWPAGANFRDADAAPDQVRPDQLRVLVNLDVTSSGVLQARPGARKAGGPALYAAIGGSGLFSVLGGVDGTTGTRTGIVGAWNGSTPGTTTFYYTLNPSLLDANWPTVAGGTLAGRYSTLVQYQSMIYVVPKPSGSGAGSRRPNTLASGAWSAVAAMPAGDSANMVRERMFVVDRDANRVYYSKATDPTVWAAPDGGSFDVNPGDGQTIRAVAVVNSQLYIFKLTRTYLFTFSADPALDGQLTLINDQLGGLDAQPWENGILVANPSGIYRLLNNYYSRLDELAPLVELVGALVGSAPTRVIIENDTLLVGPAVSGFPYTHVAMNLRTNAWSARVYPDAATAPATRYAVIRDVQAVSTPQAWNLYGDGSATLSVTPLGPQALARLKSTLDVTAAGALVSPRYELATGAIDGGDVTLHKRLRVLAAHLRNRLPAGDAAVACRAFAASATGGTLDFDLDTARQTVNVPAGGWGGKVALTQYRFLSTAFGLHKTQTTLSPTITDPLTTSDLQVRGLQVSIDSVGGSEPV